MFLTDEYIITKKIQYIDKKKKKMELFKLKHTRLKKKIVFKICTHFIRVKNAIAYKLSMKLF